MTTLIRTTTTATQWLFHRVLTASTRRGSYLRVKSKLASNTVLYLMPPKRSASSTSNKRNLPDSDADEEQKMSKASSSKRKIAASPEDTSDGESSKPTKKAKIAKPSESSADEQPTNKVLPVYIEFPPKQSGALRLATWNICGLAASSKKVNLHDGRVSFMLTSRRGSNTTWKLRMPTCSY